MDAEKFMELQVQMRQNQADTQACVRDLGRWSAEMKQKDDKLRSATKNCARGSATATTAPIRNARFKEAASASPVSNGGANGAGDATNKDKKKISGYDFRSWDKFDVDEALEEIDRNDDIERKKQVELRETEEEKSLRLKEEHRKMADEMKQTGNDFYKMKEYDKAIECYAKASVYDAENAVHPANQAMAHLQLRQWQAAEQCCTTALALDPGYVKVWMRRATARKQLQRVDDAMFDFEQVLKLDAGNKLAAAELHTLRTQQRKLQVVLMTKESAANESSGIVRPIPPPKRPPGTVEKPMRVIPIVEIDMEEETKPNEERSVVEMQTDIQFELPSSPIDFQTTLRTILKSTRPQTMLIEYLLEVCKTIVSSINDYIGMSLDATILKAIVNAVCAPPAEKHTETGAMLLGTLAKSPRFKTVKMFLSAEEKTAVAAFCKGPCPDDQSNTIRSLYL